ncbi:hypothetical protein WJX81_005534 [Elliptochloris bilobata]|uniref:Uncharacterized protein n=1 Tax=Elliptochloris bilobata TaxID=381761 RepID=A0AAW1RC96_9CHLO
MTALAAPVLEHPSSLIEHGWPYPAEKDGWTASINGLRLDAADLSAALTALVPRCHTTEPLPAWEAHILSSWFERFDRSFRRHTVHGRDIFLPIIKTRTPLPESLTLGALLAQKDHIAAPRV